MNHNHYGSLWTIITIRLAIYSLLCDFSDPSGDLKRVTLLCSYACFFSSHQQQHGWLEMVIEVITTVLDGYKWMGINSYGWFIDGYKTEAARIQLWAGIELESNYQAAMDESNPQRSPCWCGHWSTVGFCGALGVNEKSVRTGSADPADRSFRSCYPLQLRMGCSFWSN